MTNIKVGCVVTFNHYFQSHQATNQANANELWLTIKAGKGDGGENNFVSSFSRLVNL